MLFAAVITLVLSTCGDGGTESATKSDTPPAPGTTESGVDLATFCAEARKLKDDGLKVAGADARRLFAEQFTAMAKVAPDDIKADVEVVAAMWVDANENNISPSASGPDAAEAMRPYTELTKRHPNVPESGLRVTSYVSKGCGFSF